MNRKQAISNKSFGKLLKMFRKHIMDYGEKYCSHYDAKPYGLSILKERFERQVDYYISELHNKYKSSPFKRVSKFTFKLQPYQNDYSEMKFGYKFDKDFKNINFKMLVRHTGKPRFERKRQINIKIK